MTLDVHLRAKSLGVNTLNLDVSGQHVLSTRLVRGLNESATVRGYDTIVPTAAGRVARNRVEDYRTIELEGMVIGYGATPTESIRAVLTTVSGIFDSTADPADLVIELEDGDEATIECRVLNLVWTDYPDPVYRPFSVELEAVGGTGWTIATP